MQNHTEQLLRFGGFAEALLILPDLPTLGQTDLLHIRLTELES